MLWALAALAIVQPVRADSLQEVIDSPEMSKFESVGVRLGNRDANPQYFDRKPNLAKLFTEAEGAKNLLEWMGRGSADFRVQRDEFLMRNDFVMAFRVFQLRANEAKTIGVTVLVPHPKSIIARDMGLIREFSSLEPPSLKPIGQEKMEVRGKPAILYQKAEGACSLLVKLPQGALVNFDYAHCRDIRPLINLAEGLNVGRLAEKIES